MGGGGGGGLWATLRDRGTDLKQAKVTQLSMRQMMEMVHPMYVISSREKRVVAGICGQKTETGHINSAEVL